MKKIGWILGCALAITAAARVPAHAQDTDLSHSWDVRAGFFVPEQQAARTAEGDLWFTIGVERAIYEGERWKGTIGIDYYGSGSLYNIPICLNVRGNTARLRYGAGAGIGISHDFSEGKTGFTYNLLVGYELTQGAHPATADVTYRWLSTGASALNGWTFTLGTHF